MSDIDETGMEPAVPLLGQPAGGTFAAGEGLIGEPNSESERVETETAAGAEEAAALGSVPVTGEPQTGLPPGDIPPAQPAEPQQTEESWLETIKTIVYALLIALVIRTLFFQPFNIPSASMEGTLLIGDYLFVEKFSYGYSRFSAPFGRFFPAFGRVLGTGPSRGDVVVFKLPSDDSTDYIKRVIGLPGDRIQMIDDRLYINDKVVPRARVADYVERVDGYENHVVQYRETLPNGVSYLMLDRYTAGPFDNTQVFTVPRGHYFMMGDNRDNSDDSRGDVGYVPAENMVGKAEFIFFSLDESADWWQLWKWPWAVRYSRLFHVID
jgi:signal peptidase I